jgi:hypothetical protein
LQHQSLVKVVDQDSVKVGLLNVFSVIQTSRTTTINMTSLIQGSSQGVINYYIRVFGSINDIKKLNPK